MSPPWMPLYIADYRADTAHLSAAEHGAYLLLIMHYWSTGELPDDDRPLARIACMTTSEWKRARPTIERFFHDGWKHNRIDAELARAADISSKRRASAEQRHSKGNANAQQEDTHAGAGLPSPSPKKDAASAAPELPLGNEEVELFRRGKAVLGNAAGGLIKSLLKAKSGQIPLARAAIEQASTKQNPREYIGAIVRGNGEHQQQADPRL